jgi:hypothetical protein
MKHLQQKLLFNKVKVLFVCFILLAGYSCKKKSSEETTVNFHLHNPATGEVLSGVKVKVFREKYKSSTIFNGNVLGPLKSDIEAIDSAFTDDQGKATIKFKAYGNVKYAYFPYVTSSAFDGLYLYKRPSFSSPIEKDKDNSCEYLFASNESYYKHLKNTNYYDGNDKLRYREKWLYGVTSNTWSEWKVKEGLIDEIIFFSSVYSDCKIFEYEVTRNGITSYFTDTICLDPTVLDTLKIFY